MPHLTTLFLFRRTAFARTAAALGTCAVVLIPSAALAAPAIPALPASSLPPALPAAHSEDMTAVQLLADAASFLDDALAAAEAGDIETAQSAFEAFDGAWDRFEDDIRAISRQAYNEIEEEIGHVEDALASGDAAAVHDAVLNLQATIDSWRLTLASQ